MTTVAAFSIDRRTALIAAARELAPRIRAERDAIERGRDLPLPLVDALKAAGLFRILLPVALGGSDGHPVTAIRVIEEIARVDGATGWNLMIGMEQAMLAGFLPEATARTIWGRDPDAVTAGSGSRKGLAIVVPGGYRVTGRWPFNSGCGHAAYIWGNSRVCDGDTPRTRPDGEPVFRAMLFPRTAGEVIDTWGTAGLRGTGSHDFAVQDRFVPEEMAFAYVGESAWPDEPLFRYPYPSIAAVTVTAVPLGIAHGAIDALVALAGAKTPTGQTSLLRERTAVQANVARAEALLRAARAYLLESVEAVWEDAVMGRYATVAQRAQMRLAATHVGITAAQVVDLMYNAGGATSIYESSPLERCFRDVHVATQHAQVAPVNYETVGRSLLGLPYSGGLL